ncbi:hypothetical protein BH09PLA1_BH09PLA1_25880 [soil metagenome]
MTRKKSPKPTAHSKASNASNTSGAAELLYITPSLHALAVPIDSLKPDPRNARKHNDRNRASIQYSLKTFGQQKPISVDADGIILAGNGTWTEAKALGWTHIAVARSHLRGVEARAYAIADNRTGELAEWDAQELSAQLDAIAEAGISAEDLAFTDDDVDQLLKSCIADSDDESPRSRDSKSSSGGASSTEAPQNWGIRIKLRDEEHQATVLDAIERNDGNALLNALKTADVKPLVPLAGA